MRTEQSLMKTELALKRRSQATVVVSTGTQS
jgi:hypothetical protein